MKKLFYLVAFFLNVSSADCQVSIQPLVPFVGLIQKDQLWNTLIVNTSASSLNTRIELVLRDRSNGTDVMVATTSDVLLPTGTLQLNVSSIGSINYNYLNAGFDFSNNAFIPVGNYTACYNIITGEGFNQLVASECVQFDIEALSPPILTFPSDSSLLEIDPKQFVWLPPSPPQIFSELTYDLIVTEIIEGQEPEEAIQNNFPLVFESGLQFNTYTRSTVYNTIENGKWYAWQVVARNNGHYAGKSDVWVFKVKEEEPFSEIVEFAPYIIMTNKKVERGIAVNHTLKLSYHNETSDSLLNIEIFSVAENKLKVADVPKTVKFGENLWVINLKKWGLKTGQLYEARIQNQRSELYRIQFHIVEYTDN